MAKIIEKFDTPFGEYKVVEQRYNDRPARLLRSPSGAPQSGAALDDEPEQLFMYNQRFMEIALGLLPQHALVLGGGSLTFPVSLVSQLGVTVDVVEINPDLINIAKQYFEYLEPSDGMSVFVEDGFDFIKRAQSKYDYIVVDVFMDRTTPDSLISEEASFQYKRLLNAQGVVAFNCISRYHTWSDTVLKQLVRNLKMHFKYVDVYPADRGFDKRSDQNLIVVASEVENLSRHDYLQAEPVEVLGA